MRMSEMRRTMPVALAYIFATVIFATAQTTNRPSTHEPPTPGMTAPRPANPPPDLPATDSASQASDSRDQAGALPQEQAAPSGDCRPLDTTMVLLEHIQSVLDEAAIGKSGPISLDPGVVDQLRAEVAEVRLALGGKPRSQPE